MLIIITLTTELVLNVYMYDEMKDSNSIGRNMCLYIFEFEMLNLNNCIKNWIWFT